MDTGDCPVVAATSWREVHPDDAATQAANSGITTDRRRRCLSDFGIEQVDQELSRTRALRPDKPAGAQQTRSLRQHSIEAACRRCMDPHWISTVDLDAEVAGSMSSLRQRPVRLADRSTRRRDVPVHRLPRSSPEDQHSRRRNARDLCAASSDGGAGRLEKNASLLHSPHSGTPRERIIASNGDESIELRSGTRFAYVKIGRQRTIHRRSPLPDLRCVWFASNRISCKGFVNRPGGGGSIRCEQWPEMWTPLSSFHRRSSSSKRVPTTGDDGERN